MTKKGLRNVFRQRSLRVEREREKGEMEESEMPALRAESVTLHLILPILVTHDERCAPHSRRKQRRRQTPPAGFFRRLAWSGLVSVRLQPFQQDPLGKPLQPGVPGLFLGMDGPDEDALDARHPAGHHVGEQLVADHGRPRRLGLQRPLGGPDAPGNGLHVLGHAGQTEPLGELPNPMAHAVGD
jgi:hypothetical protein